MIPSRPPEMALEQLAWRLVEQTEETGTARGVLARELLVLLNELARTRRLFGELEHELDDTIHKLGAEVLQLERLYTRMAPLRTQLLTKLLAVQSERRQLRLQRAQQLHALRSQLVAAINKYAFMVPDAR